MLKNPHNDYEPKKYYLPIINSKYILEVLKKKNKPINREEIALMLKLTKKEELKALHLKLRIMERDKKIIFTRYQRYILPKNFNLLKGTVIAHQDGFGFVRINNQKDDLYLSSKEMKKVLHGDFVLIKPLYQDNKGRLNISIIKVLIPRSNFIVGRYFLKSEIGYVIPSNNRLKFNILISKDKIKNANIGDIVVVQMITRPINYNQATGKIIEILGKNMETNIAIEIALRNYDIPYTWSSQVIKQITNLSTKIPLSEKKRRINLCHLPLITIDEEDAKDFDDAVYCMSKEDGSWQLWVAIADVSYYVRPQTALDIEASNRGNSIYFPSRVIPMLPEIISNELCSLKPKVERMSLVCELKLSLKGEIISFLFYEAIISSYAKLTYNKVWKILQGDKKLCKYYKELVPHIKKLYQLYKILDNARIKRGAISFESEETKFIFNSEKRIKKIKKVKRNDAHKLIEECMILVNTAAACFIDQNKKPSLYRVHDRPKQKNIINLRKILNELNLILPGGMKPKSIDYAKIINKVNNRSDHEFLKTMILRSMNQAVYDNENRGHFGLALKSYTHFTSPIRRYSDLVLHRLIKYLSFNKYKKDKYKLTFTGSYCVNINEIIKLSKHCSLTERRADEATKDVIDWLKCDFIQNYIGSIFAGIIINIFNFGFFVRLNDFFIDGLVHISSLNNDFYYYDNIKQILIGSSSGISYRIGDKVKISIQSVYVDECKINFILV